MPTLVDALKGRRVFAEFPVAGVPEWMAICEVLVQGGVSAWAFPPGQGALLDEIRHLYGRRAVFGIRGVRTPEEVRDAVALGAAFVTSPVASAALLEAAGEVPIALGALTPNEVQQAVSLGARAVQVYPADLLGMAYPRMLGELFDGVSFVAAGRLEPFQATMWTEAGATVIGLAAPTLFGDNGIVTDLDGLRRRCQGYVT